MNSVIKKVLNFIRIKCFNVFYKGLFCDVIGIKNRKCRRKIILDSKEEMINGISGKYKSMSEEKRMKEKNKMILISNSSVNVDLNALYYAIVSIIVAMVVVVISYVVSFNSQAAFSDLQYIYTMNGNINNYDIESQKILNKLANQNYADEKERKELEDNKEIFDSKIESSKDERDKRKDTMKKSLDETIEIFKKDMIKALLIIILSCYAIFIYSIFSSKFKACRKAMALLCISILEDIEKERLNLVNNQEVELNEAAITIEKNVDSEKLDSLIESIEDIKTFLGIKNNLK